MFLLLCKSQSKLVLQSWFFLHKFSTTLSMQFSLGLFYKILYHKYVYWEYVKNVLCSTKIRIILITYLYNFKVVKTLLYSSESHQLPVTSFDDWINIDITNWNSSSGYDCLVVRSRKEGKNLWEKNSVNGG